MESIISILLFWILPIWVCCVIGKRQEKDVLWIFIGAVLFSWIGGLLALALVREGTLVKPDEEAELELQRVEAERKALGQGPGQLSAAKKGELERLLGGKK